MRIFNWNWVRIDSAQFIDHLSDTLIGFKIDYIFASRFSELNSGHTLEANFG